MEHESELLENPLRGVVNLSHPGVQKLYISVWHRSLILPPLSQDGSAEQMNNPDLLVNSHHARRPLSLASIGDRPHRAMDTKIRDTQRPMQGRLTMLMEKAMHP